MAHKKGAGSTDNGRDSHSKRLGVKMFGGERAIAGNILVRQRGTKYHPGENVYMGRDHTLHAGIDGVVTFKRTKKDRNYVSIMPFDLVAAAASTSGQERLAVPETVAPVAKTRAKAPAKSTKVEEAAPVAEAPSMVTEEIILPAAPEVEAPAAEEETPTAAAPDVEAAVPIMEEEVEVSPAPEPEATKAPAAQKAPKLDDLKIVEGIGPKIEQLLHEGGINTWVALAEAPVDRLREILDAAGARYQIHDPSTWPAQSKFAAAGHWEELKEYQEMLTGGRDVAE